MLIGCALLSDHVYRYSQYEFKGRRWKRISKAAKAFVEDLLVVDPNDRATAAEASSASWLNRRLGATTRNAREDEISNARSSILKYSKYSKLQKMALMVIAHKSTSAEIGILRKIFYQYDTERDGILSYDEFKAAMKEVGLSEDDYRTIFNAVVSFRKCQAPRRYLRHRAHDNPYVPMTKDLDGTGKIRYTEFLAATIEAHGVISEEKLAEAFDRLDADDSGYISAENLAEMLGNDFPKDEIQSILREASQDGKVTYADFLALWESRKEKQWRKEELNEFAVELAPSISTDISVLSNETHDSLPLEDDKEVLMARASFIDGKKMSERKLIVSQVPSEFKESSSSAAPTPTPTSAECNKEAAGCKKARVMFSDDAPAIILPAAKSVESVLTGDV
jgi:Ca2+-binding EF-hand superfamily protein